MVTESESPTRRRLVRTCGDLVHRRGYAATGVQEICDVAGVRKGSFYHFFPSKAALVVATLEPAWREHLAEVLEPAFVDRPLLTGLQQWGDRLAEIHRRHRDEPDGHVRGCRFGNLAAECAGREPEVAEAVAGFLAEMVAYVNERVVEGATRGDCAVVDPDTAGDRLVSHMEGLAVLAKVRNDPDLLRRLGGDSRVLLQGGA